MKREEPEWVLPGVVLAIHEAQLRAHGGLAGIRDIGLLESAVSRPRHLFAYEKAGLAKLATSYATAIIRNHPFIDGNKRTAFSVAVLFLEINGRRFIASESESAIQILGLVARSVDDAAFEAWLESKSKPARAPRKKTTKRRKRD